MDKAANPGSISSRLYKAKIEENKVNNVARKSNLIKSHLNVKIYILKLNDLGLISLIYSLNYLTSFSPFGN